MCEYIALVTGMGYGMMLVPVLLMAGFRPLQIVPVILISESISGIAGALFHYKFKNVDFNFGTRDFKIVTVLIICSIIGAIIAALTAVSISEDVIRLLIGIIIVAMGIAVLLMRHVLVSFSWIRITMLGLVAAFNKGISGGGYGPLVTGGQVLSGIPSKNAVGVTALAKAVACIAGVLTYLFATERLDLFLAPPLIIGAILSAPVAALSVKRIREEKIKLFIAIATISLGILTVVKTFL